MPPLEALKTLAETAVRAVRSRARAGVVGGLLVLVSVAVLVLIIGIAIAVGSQVITQFNQTTGSIPRPVGTLLTTISRTWGERGERRSCKGRATNSVVNSSVRHNPGRSLLC
jgi:predicted PurR-regulated permease PerM